MNPLTSNEAQEQSRTLSGLPGAHIHFMGIGGVSMAALARWCRAEGFEVSGCDLVGGSVLDELAGHGISTCTGHDASHVAGIDVLVHSMAVPHDHPRASGVLVLRRIALLGELFSRRKAIAVTGTHGKSTTTAMLATILLDLEPGTSVQLGASLPIIGGSMRYGPGTWLAGGSRRVGPGFRRPRRGRRRRDEPRR